MKVIRIGKKKMKLSLFKDNKIGSKKTKTNIKVQQGC